jgi:hypothetical protein
MRRNNYQNYNLRQLHLLLVSVFAGFLGWKMHDFANGDWIYSLNTMKRFGVTKDKAFAQARHEERLKWCQENMINIEQSAYTP